MGSKAALLVELSCGRSIKIGGDQLIDVWDVAAACPRTPQEWEPLRDEASSMLTELPPHMLDLRPLWQRLLQQRGGSKMRVDSARVAEALFNSPHAQKTTRRPTQGGSKDGTSRLLAQLDRHTAHV